MPAPPLLGSAGAPVPPPGVRVIALDLDGTTVDLRQQLHPRTRAAVRAAVAAGIHVVAATGRMYRSALPWATELGLRDPVIAYQGAEVRAMPTAADEVVDGVPQGRLLAADPLDGEVATEVLRLCREEGWHVQAYRDDRLLVERDGPAAEYYAGIAQVGWHRVHDLAPVMAAGSTKVVVVILDEAEATRCETALRAAVGARARVVRSLPEFVEITHSDAGKGRQLARLCAGWGVDHRLVVAAGDAPNDADMLRVAGFAAAVVGAAPAALAEADVVIGSPEEGGVADLIAALGIGVQG